MICSLLVFFFFFELNDHVLSHYHTYIEWYFELWWLIFYNRYTSLLLQALSCNSRFYEVIFVPLRWIPDVNVNLFTDFDVYKPL